MTKVLSSLLAGLIFASSAYGQASTVIQSETRLVLVDTVVTDKKGNYVRDLTEKDFKVFEDNKEQTITSFTHETGATTQDDSRKHYTLLFFDDTTTTASLQSYARQAARSLVQANAGPNRLMAIAEFGSVLRVTQNFTEDPERLTAALGGAQFAGSAQEGGASRRGSANVNDYATRGALGALRSMVSGLAGLPGRKTLILVSSGYAGSGPTLSDITAIVEASKRANVAIYPIVPAPGQSVAMDDGGASDSASPGRRSRGGRGGGGMDAAADTSAAGLTQVLYSLANGSGGYVINAAAELTGALAKVGKEQEEYYILGYTPSKDAAPGVCHSLKVKVDRGGEVRSRTGYCEAKTQDVLSGTPTERDLEGRISANATPSVTGSSLLAPFFYTAANTARVYVELEVPAGAIHFAKDKGKFRSVLNVVGIASLPDGTVKGRFSDAVKLEFEDKKDADAFSSKPFHYEKQFKMAPGKYDFKLVFSSSANQFGRSDMPLTIEPWDPAKFGLSGLVLSRRVLAAKEATAGLDVDAPEDSVPLKVDGVQVIPTGSNRFSKFEKCYVYAEMYEPALVVPGVKAADVPVIGVRMELLDPKTGKVKTDLGLTRLPSPPLTGSSAVPIGLTLPVSQIETGVYALRLTAVDAKGNELARTIDIQIEN